MMVKGTTRKCVWWMPELIKGLLFGTAENLPQMGHAHTWRAETNIRSSQEDVSLRYRSKTQSMFLARMTLNKVFPTKQAVRSFIVACTDDHPHKNPPSFKGCRRQPDARSLTLSADRVDSGFTNDVERSSPVPQLLRRPRHQLGANPSKLTQMRRGASSMQGC